MEYVIGMAVAFAGIIAVFSAAHLFGRKDKGRIAELVDHQIKANNLAHRRASALERIADTLENSK